jgi:S1-C subfamily serine protease
MMSILREFVIKRGDMMKKIILGFLISFILLFSGCDFELTLDNKVETTTLNHISTVIMDANVKISTSTYKINFFQKVYGPHSAVGSGVIIKEEKVNNDIYYYVLTNAHVIHLDDEFLHEYEVEDINNNVLTAELITKNENYDLAILKFKAKSELTVIELASKNPRLRDTVFSVGSPSGKQNIITAGKVVAYSEIKNVDYKIIIHEAYIYRGSSGSMLINENYELVGINTWGFVPEDKGIDEDFVRGGATPILKILEFLENDFNK